MSKIPIFFSLMLLMYMPFFCSADEGIQIFTNPILQELLELQSLYKQQKLLLQCGAYQISANIAFYTQEEQTKKIENLTKSFGALIKNRTPADIAQYSHIFYSQNNDFSCRKRQGGSLILFYMDGSLKDRVA